MSFAMKNRQNQIRFIAIRNMKYWTFKQQWKTKRFPIGCLLLKPQLIDVYFACEFSLDIQYKCCTILSSIWFLYSCGNVKKINVYSLLAHHRKNAKKFRIYLRTFTASIIERSKNTHAQKNKKREFTNV